MLKRLFKKEVFFILVILVFAAFSFRDFFRPGYFPMHDDLQMMRQLSMEKCFLDGQIPCRWVEDMGYGFGYPLFNFYPPLPYLVGQGIRLLGFEFTETVKLVFSLSLFISGVGMYFLAKEFFGKIGGLISAVFYIWAPYHALDIYVRGAMNEAWALVFFPLILWTSYRLIIEKGRVGKWMVALALSWFGLFTSHNLMVIIFAPFFAVWILAFFWKEKKFTRLPHMFFSGILSLALAAFFTVPALVEQREVQVNTLISGYYDFSGHFVSIYQILVSRFWGYGPSVFGTDDGMAFPVGHFHWISSLAVGAFFLVRFLRKRKIDKALVAVSLMVAAGWFAAFMAHARSTPIWLTLGPIAFVQFPWRFLILTTLAFSFSAGALVLIFEKSKKILPFFVAVLLALLVVWNWEFFRVERMGPVTDEEKFSGEAWRLQQTAGIYDYLPNTARQAPQRPRQEMVESFTEGTSFSNEKQGTYWAEFEVESPEDSLIRINILKFPGWKVFVDGEETEVFIPEDEHWGRMHINVPEGKRLVRAELFDTPVRKVSNWTSLIAWVGLGGYIVWRRKLL